ncbi:MAG: hypothetical protein V7K35_10510 [Nostoc sp.]|uniref:hypothetical protein n=1 Tax=Nostoc sp. TaxID=1180 RepID=UPI002FF9C3C5
MGFLWILNGCCIYAVEIRWRDRSQLLPSLRSHQLVNGFGKCSQINPLTPIKGGIIPPLTGFTDNHFQVVTL